MIQTSEIKKKTSFVEEKKKVPVSARVTLMSMSPKSSGSKMTSSRVISTKSKAVPTTAVGVKVAKIGLVSPKRTLSSARPSSTVRNGFNTTRAVSKPKSPPRAKKPLTKQPDPELLEPLKAHNL